MSGMNRQERKQKIIELLTEYLSDGEWKSVREMCFYIEAQNKQFSVNSYKIGSFLIHINTMKKKINDITYHKMLP